MKNRHRLSARHLIGPVVAGLLAAPSPVFAQDAPQAGAGSVNPDEIVVTATRRADLLENVPASVVALSGKSLETAGVSKFQDLATIAPGVQISRSGTYVQPAIRGVSTTLAAGGQETNVAIYVDGFYTSDQLSINQDFANIQDVQVLKGPQGTLYGRNATGGAILITTRSPTDEWQVEGTASYAPRYEDRAFSTFIGGPIAQNIKVSVAGYYRKSDGYYKDINDYAPNIVLDPVTYTFGGRSGKYSYNQTQVMKRGKGALDPGAFENWSVRPKLVAEFGDLKLTASYVHTFINDLRSFAYGIVGAPANTAATYGGYPVAINQRDKTSLSFQPVSEITADEWNGTVEYSLGSAGTIVSRSAYRKQKDYQVFDLDGTPANSAVTPGSTYVSVQNNRRKTFTQQLDYSGEFGPLAVLAGAFYYDDKFHTPAGFEDLGFRAGLPAFGIPPNPTYNELWFNTKAWAVYLDGTYNLGDKLYVTVGGRYSHDEKELRRDRVDANGNIVPNAISACSTGGVNSVFDPACGYDPFKHISKNAFTPHVVLRYNLSPGSNVYASISRGFKAGTINSVSPHNSLLPETVTAYEVGYKTARGGFRAEVSGFYYDYKNNQVAAIDASKPTASNLIVNSGGAEIYGIDTALSYRFPSAPLNLRAGLSWLHARYTDFANATNVTLNAAGTSNVSVVGDWTGRRLVRAPDWTGSVGADYTANLAGAKLVFSGTVTYSSRYAPQNASYQCAYALVAGVNTCLASSDHLTKGRFDENGYVLANAQIAWTDPSDHFTVTLFGENITNTRYKINTSGFTYSTYTMYNEPRTVGLKLSARY